MINTLDTIQSNWYAVSTRYKCEKSVHKSLREKEIHSFLPIQKIVRVWGKRKRKVELPLISCYVFVKITQAEYLSVLKEDNVLCFVKIANRLIAIPDHEINTLKRIIGQNDFEPNLITNNYRIGDEVEITYGALTGLRGHLITEEGKNSFVIKLKKIGCSLELQVKANHLRKINKL